MTDHLAAILRYLYRHAGLIAWLAMDATFALLLWAAYTTAGTR